MAPSPETSKSRLDVLLVERGLAESRERAQALILAGRVRVEGMASVKAGHRIARDAVIHVEEPALRYVGRGGLKLEAALREFGIDPTDAVALDIGSSTGGFTDCLLQHGARRVIAVDVGRGQLHERLRADHRVELHEGVNARYLPPDFLPAPTDLIVMDLSFISLGKVLPCLYPLLADSGRLIALIKPQFEAGPTEVPRGGVIRDPEVHRRVLEKTAADFTRAGFERLRVIPSPITGTDGNREFLALARRIPKSAAPAEQDLPSGGI